LPLITTIIQFTAKGFLRKESASQINRFLFTHNVVLSIYIATIAIPF
jgi:hypothetical protein